jgi:sugar lactone lactonase YvrE
MIFRRTVLALVLAAIGVVSVRAEPAVMASGSYPEGLLWNGGKMYFTEMGADQVTIVENGSTRAFWRDPGCGPTSIAPFGPTGFLINCHLGHQVVEVSVAGATGRRFNTAANGLRINDPNASVGDGQGGVYFSDSGVFSVRAPATGRVYHVSAMGVMTEVVSGIKYANGVQFDPATRTLFVSEHLARRILALTLDSRQRVTATKVFADFAQIPATKAYSYEEAGPDGLILRPSYLVVAEYGEGRVHVFQRDGTWRNTLKVSMPFVDTVAFDGAGNLWAGGSFQNSRPPFEGAVVRFPQSEWEQPAR